MSILLVDITPSTELKPLRYPDRNASGKDLHCDRCLARRAPITDRRTERPPGDHIGLPMRLRLHARDCVVDGQHFKCPDPWVLLGVVGDERCDKARLERHFAARKALATAALEPLIGIVALNGTRATEGDFQRLGADSRNY